jgi:hypothetical protein
MFSLVLCFGNLRKAVKHNLPKFSNFIHTCLRSYKLFYLHVPKIRLQLPAFYIFVFNSVIPGFIRTVLRQAYVYRTFKIVRICQRCTFKTKKFVQRLSAPGRADTLDLLWTRYVSTPLRPELHLDACLHYRGLCSSWTCLHYRGMS